MSKPILAHVKQNPNGEWELHLLEEHLHAVAYRAGVAVARNTRNVVGRIETGTAA